MQPKRPPTAYAYDVAISAVRYDAMLVADLNARLAPRLNRASLWAGHSGEEAVGGAAPLLAESSRLVVVLHQRLWQHEPMTQLDEVALRERLVVRPNSVVVVTLDHTPLPAWLASAERCDFAAAGLDGVVEFTLTQLTSSAEPYQAPPVEPAAPPAPHRWPEGPAPYLAQPRAQSSLRRELDALATESKEPLRVEEERSGAPIAELLSLPHRLIARVGEAGISFSWLGGGTVAEGRLLVIQWGGLSGPKGAAALRTATAVRECTYRPESTGPDNWRWRSDERNGRACSSADLVQEWFAGIAMGSPATAAAR